MKPKSKLLTLLTVLASITLNAAITPSNPDLIPAGREILDYFESQYGSKHISGVNIYPRVANAYLSTGKRGVIWMENAEFIKDSDIDKLIEDYRKYRPILCFGWHWALGDKWNAWGEPINRSNPDPHPLELEVARVLNPNTPEHAMMLADLDAVAAWLQRFEDAGIPILWRGLHEHGGGWFWYDDDETPENSAELWRFVYNYFTHTKGLDNLIWYYNAAQGINDDWDFRKRFYPGNNYVDFVDVNMYDSDHKVDVDGQKHYFDMMTYISDGQKMIGGGDQPNPHNPDYMAEGRFPKWLLGTTWEGAPFLPDTRGYTTQWASYFFKANNVISLDEAPAFGASLGQPDRYPNIYPEVGIIHPEFQTWTHDGDPVIRASARDRQGSVTQVEFFAYNLATGAEQSIGLGTHIGNNTYERVWTGAPNGFYRISARATDNSGNVSDTMNMGDSWPNDDGWKNFAYVTKGFFNLAMFKPATASSTFQDRVPSRATDGNYESEWESDYTAGGNTQNESLEIDLGGTFPIDKVVIRWHWKAYAESFAIDIDNGSGWNQVYSETGFRGETTYAAASFCEFPSVNARKIRLRFTDMVANNNHLYFGYKIAEVEIPVPLAQAPAGTPRHLELHNRRVYWKDEFARTVFGTPASVEMTGSGSYNAPAFREDYFDAVGEQFCARARFDANFGQLIWRPYDNSPRNMNAFANGHLHFWARSSVDNTYQLKVRDNSGVSTIRQLELTPQWQRFVVPVSEINDSADLANVREPFIISKGGTAANLYLRQVYWSSESFETDPIGIIDPSLNQDNTAFTTPNKPSFANVFDAGKGWLVGGPGTPRWRKNATQDRVEAVNGNVQGLAQVIADFRETTGTQTFSLKVHNVEGDNVPNYFRAMVFGVNVDQWQTDLVNFDDTEFVAGPYTETGPVGDLIADILVDGENLNEETLYSAAEFGPGYDEIILLFWTEGVNPTGGDVLWFDDVKIDETSIPGDTGGGTGGGETILDNIAADGFVNNGFWTHTTWGDFIGENFNGITATTTRTQTAQWNLQGFNGSYTIYYRASGGARPSNQKIQVSHASGTTNLTVDLAVPNGTWVPLGDFVLNDSSIVKALANFDPIGGNVAIADAIKLVGDDDGSGSGPGGDDTGTGSILETFDWADGLGGAFNGTPATATGADGLQWTYNRAANDDSKSITGVSLILQRRMSETTTGWIEAPLPAAITGFKLTFRPRFHGKSQIRVTVDGVSFDSVIADGHTDTRTMDETVSAPAGATLRIESIGNPDGSWKDVLIDDLELIGSGGTGGGTPPASDGFTETFSGVDLGTSYWSTGSTVNFTGVEGLSWTAYRCMNGPDNSAQLQYGGNGSLTVQLEDGFSSVSFKFRPEFGAGTKVIVKKNSTIIQSTTMNTDPSGFATVNVPNLNAASGDTVEFAVSSDSKNAAILDDIAFE